MNLTKSPTQQKKSAPDTLKQVSKKIPLVMIKFPENFTQKCEIQGHLLNCFLLR